MHVVKARTIEAEDKARTTSLLLTFYIFIFYLIELKLNNDVQSHNKVTSFFSWHYVAIFRMRTVNKKCHKHHRWCGIVFTHLATATAPKLDLDHFKLFAPSDGE